MPVRTHHRTTTAVRSMVALCVLAGHGFASGCGGGGEPGQACAGQTPRCEGETAVACVEGETTRTPCPAGTYCNLGQCAASKVSLPADAAPHSDDAEWWYYTGHLGDGARAWGFQVTIFQTTFGTVSGFGYMCHVGLTDLSAREHYHLDTISFAPTTWSRQPIDLQVDHCRLQLGGDGRDHVVGIIPAGKEKDGHPGEWRVELDLVPRKRVALHGSDGIVAMGDSGGSSYYYSYTQLEASGTLTTPAGQSQVTGQAWMDHQWGDFDINAFKGWDWWSIQLDDGHQIMLYQFRDWQSRLVHQAGTIVDPAGSLTDFEGLDTFTVTPRRQWSSTHTDGIYPLDWDITIVPMAFSLAVRTTVDDQEMYNLAQSYWEGAVAVNGNRAGQAVAGKGYVELTGYATDPLDPRPAQGGGQGR